MRTEQPREGKLPRRPWAMFLHQDHKVHGCQAYRMLIPADELSRQGYLCDYLYFEQAQKIAQAEAARGLAGLGIGSYDLYILPRFAVQANLGTDMLRQAGKKVVFEVDDDFTNQYRRVMSDDDVHLLWDFVTNVADAVTVTTPYLADLMRKRAHKPVYILPNSVRWDEWQRPKRERLTIGLTGSDTHGKDWGLLARVLPRVLQRHPEVDLYVLGWLPDWAKDLALAFPEQVILDGGWYTYPEYAPRAAGFHITLCPLDPDDEFNKSKSAIKAIEAMACGSLAIATDTNVYRPALGHGSRGLLVKHTPEEWEAALESALTSSGLREKLTRKARAYARTHHAIDQTWSQWLHAYRDIVHLH